MKSILVVALLGIGSAAAAELISEDSIESMSKLVRLPVADAGVVTVSSCESCRTVPLRVTAQTTYIVNDQPVPLRRFKQLLEGPKSFPVLVAYLPGTPNVTRIVITSPIQP